MHQHEQTAIATADLGRMSSAKVLTAVNRSQKAMSKLLSTCLGHHNLNTAEWTLLSHLVDGPKTPTEIAKLMDVKTPYMALLVRTLKAKNSTILAEINRIDDTRSKKISLTTDGQAYVLSIEVKLQECIQRELAQRVDPSDLATFFTVSSFIADNVKHHTM